MSTFYNIMVLLMFMLYLILWLWEKLRRLKYWKKFRTETVNLKFFISNSRSASGENLSASGGHLSANGGHFIFVREWRTYFCYIVFWRKIFLADMSAIFLADNSPPPADFYPPRTIVRQLSARASCFPPRFALSDRAVYFPLGFVCFVALFLVWTFKWF